MEWKTCCQNLSLPPVDRPHLTTAKALRKSHDGHGLGLASTLKQNALSMCWLKINICPWSGHHRPSSCDSPLHPTYGTHLLQEPNASKLPASLLDSLCGSRVLAMDIAMAVYKRNNFSLLPLQATGNSMQMRTVTDAPSDRPTHCGCAHLWRL
jgi:hypothetical protein